LPSSSTLPKQKRIRKESNNKMTHKKGIGPIKKCPSTQSKKPTIFIDYYGRATLLNKNIFGPKRGPIKTPKNPSR